MAKQRQLGNVWRGRGEKEEKMDEHFELHCKDEGVILSGIRDDEKYWRNKTAL